MNILIKKDYEKYFSLWIALLIFLIISMIVIGGLTRLTDSGLSITEWNLFEGILPPFSNDKWEFYFSLYKEIPQYNLINVGITLDEFKYIYWWEYIHRLLGRLIGITFLIPFVFFLYKKVISKSYTYKLFFLFLLICLQGFIGWYMVKSGLTNNVSVSHYRLSLHLFTAFIILASLVWIYLNLINSKNFYFFSNFSNFISLKFFIFLIFSQIIFGAFVSGLDAGKIYQTWPLMNESYVPDDIEFSNILGLISFNQHSFVQFFHRNMAYLILIIYIYVGLKLFFTNKDYLFQAYLSLLFVIALQILLGILVLITDVNIVVASLHQISSILLIILSLKLYHRSFY